MILKNAQISSSPVEVSALVAIYAGVRAGVSEMVEGAADDVPAELFAIRSAVAVLSAGKAGGSSRLAPGTTVGMKCLVMIVLPNDETWRP